MYYYLYSVPDKSSDSFCELSVRWDVKSIETFTKQLDELSSEGEQLHEGGDGEGGWVVLVHVVDLVDFKQVPKKSVQLHVKQPLKPASLPNHQPIQITHPPKISKRYAVF